MTNSRADCALTQQMIGCIKAISPCVKSASAKLFLDLHTVLAPSGEERTLGAAAQVERTGWCCRRFDSSTQTRCGSATVMVLVSSASGPRVRGCPRAPRNFNTHPVASASQPQDNLLGHAARPLAGIVAKAGHVGGRSERTPE